MPPPDTNASTRTSRIIAAPRDVLYGAFTDPAALAAWQAPDEMSATMHAFDARVGGGYTMSLHYPECGEQFAGKTTEMEDRYTARFIELAPPSRIVQAIEFDTDDPAFLGEMTMTVTLEERAGGTEATSDR